MKILIPEYVAGEKFNLTELFAGVPDDVALSAASRDLDMMSGQRCLVGWVVREQIARATGVDAEEAWTLSYGPTKAAELFGGTSRQWQAVFYGVNHPDGEAPLIEAAWTNRVMKAAGVLA